MRSHFLPSFNPLFNLYNIIYWSLRHRKLQDGAILYSFSNNPAVHGFGRTKAKFTVFDVIHNWWSYPWHGQYHKLFNETLPTYDKIITDSPLIQAKLQTAGFASSLMLPGVSEHWLDDNPFCDSKNARVCFFGNLRGNSDLDFVHLVHERLGLQIFGRIDASAGNLGHLFSSVSVVANEELPRKLAQYNVVILPYKNDEFSITISPAKYFECFVWASSGHQVAVGSFARCEGLPVRLGA